MSMMQITEEGSLFEPLLAALRKIQFWLESDYPPPVMIARQTKEEFAEQLLPSHCVVRKRKLLGSRQIATTGKNGIIELAFWPKDALVEQPSPVLLFVLNGEADIRISDYVVSCRSGDCIFIPAGMPQSDTSRPYYEKIAPESHCDILSIYPNLTSSSFFGLFIRHSQGEKNEAKREGETCWFVSHAYCSLFEILTEALQTHGASKSTFYLVQSLASLLKQGIESGNALNTREFPSESVSLKQQSPIQRAMQYARHHFNRPLTIAQVARWVGLSRSVFVSRFREETGVSFNAYLTQLRLEHAELLLSQSDLSINKISSSVGLSTAQFRNLIRTKFHCSPREYREIHK